MRSRSSSGYSSVARASASFYEVLAAALRDMRQHGFDSQARVDFWAAQLREAAERMTGSAARAQGRLRDALQAIYRQQVDRGGVLTRTNASRFTLEIVAPALRGELDRRIAASAELIKLNRQEAIDKTLRRFRGWATSIPAGGSPAHTREETKLLRRGLKSLPFEERRLLVDQGHKLNAAISETVAVGGAAIAAVWHSHWRQANYDYREAHKERDQVVYLLRGSWAAERGLVRPGDGGWLDDVTRPGEEPFCRCYLTWLYNLRQLPTDMLTSRGRDALAEARKDSALEEVA